MTRRTVDITVDAYDAPTLAALAKRRDHQRALGHADDSTSRFSAGFRVAFHGDLLTASELKRQREEEFAACEGSALTVLLGEVAEAIEARTTEERIYELLDVAAVCLRIASKMQRDLDARDST